MTDLQPIVKAGFDETPPERSSIPFWMWMIGWSVPTFVFICMMDPEKNGYIMTNAESFFFQAILVWAFMSGGVLLTWEDYVGLGHLTRKKSDTIAGISALCWVAWMVAGIEFLAFVVLVREVFLMMPILISSIWSVIILGGFAVSLYTAKWFANEDFREKIQAAQKLMETSNEGQVPLTKVTSENG